MTTMMIKSIVATALALSAVPCEASIRRLYRVQPTQKVMPSSSTSTNNPANFEKFDDDAKRALRELMIFPQRHLSVEIISSMEFLSLSYAPVMSMTPPPTMEPEEISDVPTTGNNNGNVAAVNRAGESKNGATNDFNSNKPAAISVSVFLLIAAMAVTALVVRKYKRAVLMAANGSDDQSTVVSNTIPIV
jgi:hypothetical protein